MTPVPAIVLAAGGKQDKLAAAEGVADKAMLDVAGRPMIDWVLEGLSKAQRVSGITVVADDGSPLHTYLVDRASVVTPQGEGFLDSLTAGMSAFSGDARVLVSTGDVPLIKPDQVDDYLLRCDTYPRADLCYSIIRAEECEREFPGGHRTVMRMREGTFTGGNVVTLAPGFLTREAGRIGEVFAARKSPLKLARMFGVGLLLKAALGVASLTAVVAQARAILGCDVAAVETPYAALGFDVDKPDDLQLVREHLAKG